MNKRNVLFADEFGAAAFHRRAVSSTDMFNMGLSIGLCI
jgi:hypothetical protein